MKEMKARKNCTKHYTSFAELRADFGLPPLSTSIRNKEKLEKIRNEFVGVCKCCGTNLTYISGTNTLACQNEKCKGFKHVEKNEDGTDKVWYTPFIRVLDEKGLKKALRLFAD